MKMLLAALVLTLTVSIIFASSQDAFAQIRPSAPIIDLVKTANPTIGLNPTFVTYTYTVTNNGDQPCVARTNFPGTGLVDIPLGTIMPPPNTTLQPGQTITFTRTTTLTQTTTNSATYTCRNDAGQLFSDTDSETVEIFLPSVLVEKTGDTLSKIGDDVTYDFTITNMGSANSPNLVLDSVSDDVLGSLTAVAAAATPDSCSSLAPGDSCSFSVTRTVLALDPDPLGNTVTVHYHSNGFANDVTDSDSHSVNLFQPSVLVEKTGDTLSKIGDDVTYDFTITNMGSADSPNLVLDSVSDDVLGSLTAVAAAATPDSCSSLAPGDSCSFSVTRTVLALDPDPLVNTVTVHYHPDGFPNDVTDSDSHSVDLFQASILVTKDGPATADVGDAVTYDFTITNTGSADSPDLVYDSAIDSLIGPLDAVALPDCAVLAPLASCSFSVVRTVLITDPDPLDNTVTVLYHPDGFPNDVTDSDSHSVDIIVPSAVDVVKIADPSLIEAGETVTYTVDITNIGSSTLTLCEGTDDNGTPFDTSDDIDVDALDIGPFTLVSGESKTFTYTDEVFADRINTVEFFCVGPDGLVGDMDSAQVTVLVVGGNYLPMDSAALLLAGIQTSAAWLVPTIAGLAGIGLYLVKFRVREN